MAQDTSGGMTSVGGPQRAGPAGGAGGSTSMSRVPGLGAGAGEPPDGGTSSLGGWPPVGWPPAATSGSLPGPPHHPPPTPPEPPVSPPRGPPPQGPLVEPIDGATPRVTAPVAGAPPAMPTAAATTCWAVPTATSPQ